MDTCDPYPLRTHPSVERLKRVRHRCVSMPRVAYGSYLGSDEERRGCSDHRRQTGHGDKELSEGFQLIGNSDQAVSFAHLQRAYTSLSAVACGPERSSLGKTSVSEHEMEHQITRAYSNQSPILL